MLSEIDVIQDISRKFEGLEIPYMLTGSIAMNYYASPRMTRDIDVVVVMGKENIDKVVEAFGMDYYISKEAVELSIENESMFNMIHLESVIKVDCIVRKSTEYRQLEFERRHEITLKDFKTYVVSKEDLVLSKLVWAKDSRSEMQLKDVSNLLATGCDEHYLVEWADQLGVSHLLCEVRDA